MDGLLLVACRTLDAYTVEGAGGRGRSPTDRRSFGPGARTETHASRPEARSLPWHGQAGGVLVTGGAFFPRRRPPPAEGEGRAAAGKECSGREQGSDGRAARGRRRGRSAPPEKTPDGA